MLSSAQWFSPLELATLALPDMPATTQGITQKAKAEGWFLPENEGKSWRKRDGKGGGYEFTPFVLPLPARAALAIKAQDSAPVVADEMEVRERQDIWQRYDALPDKLKERAKKAHRIVMAVEMLVDAGCRKKIAVLQIASMEGIGATTIMNWYRDVRGLNRCDWLAGLAPHYAKRAEQVECPTEAWDILKADYLRLTVIAAQLVTRSPVIALNPDSQQARQQITAELTAYYPSKGIGGKLYVQEVAAVLTTINGTSNDLIAPTADEQLGNTEIAVAGAISWQSAS